MGRGSISHHACPQQRRCPTAPEGLHSGPNLPVTKVTNHHQSHHPNNPVDVSQIAPLLLLTRVLCLAELPLSSCGDAPDGRTGSPPKLPVPTAHSQHHQLRHYLRRCVACAQQAVETQSQCIELLGTVNVTPDECQMPPQTVCTARKLLVKDILSNIQPAKPRL